MNQSEQIRYEWNDINWPKVERDVFKLQKRIYQASERGDTTSAHRLQRLAMRSWDACLLAVRKVTQDNRGKKTAGIDGVKSLQPEQRLALAKRIQQSPYETQGLPTRRVWIPKPGTQEKRPLGIPTMEDRAKQALAKLALEPEWEAKFESGSFGFRPGKSAHDAIKYIYCCISDSPRYVLDADISKCFDRINHKALLEKMGTYPQLRRLVKRWLKAGVMDGDLFPTDEGTPQGGVISPLLANIALHGLQSTIENAFPNHPRLHPYTGERCENPNSRWAWRPKVIRYADDFVILHMDLRAIMEAKEIAEKWLLQMGLELNEGKTKITHTLEKVNGESGFDFLGFNIRQFEVGKTHVRKVSHTRLPFRTFIGPSKASKKAHVQKLSEVIRGMRASSQENLIARLNPIITGWGNYFSIGFARELKGMDNVLFQQLKRWARRRHPKKHWKWVSKKYWHFHKGRKWTFCTPDKKAVQAHHARKVNRLRPVKASSPFNGDWPYWTRRLGRHPGIAPSIARLMKFQHGKCAYCNLSFMQSDVLEKDHITLKSEGGSKNSFNLQLLHAHCHDVKSASDFQSC